MIVKKIGSFSIFWEAVTKVEKIRLLSTVASGVRRYLYCNIKIVETSLSLAPCSSSGLAITTKLPATHM